MSKIPKLSIEQLYREFREISLYAPPEWIAYKFLLLGNYVMYSNIDTY
jgi:hypothetical protein